MQAASQRANGKGRGRGPPSGTRQATRSHGTCGGVGKASSSGLSAVERTTCMKEVSHGAREDAMQNTAVGFQPSSAGVAEGGLATGNTELAHDKATGVQPSPANSGNAECAEGKGDGKGDGTSDGFKPSPATVGHASGAAEVDGDGQGQVNDSPPSPASTTSVVRASDSEPSSDDDCAENNASPDRCSSSKWTPMTMSLSGPLGPRPTT